MALVGRMQFDLYKRFRILIGLIPQGRSYLEKSSETELVDNNAQAIGRMTFKPIRTGRGVESTPPTVFCPIPKKSSYDTYLKFLEFFQLLVADTPSLQN